MFCKSLNSARARLARVSVRFGLVWLESRLGLGSFFSSENESLGSASKSNSLGSASKARHHSHPYMQPYMYDDTELSLVYLDISIGL